VELQGEESFIHIGPWISTNYLFFTLRDFRGWPCPRIFLHKTHFNSRSKNAPNFNYI